MSENVPPPLPSATLSRESWLRLFMDKNSLKNDGSNFTDWEAALRNACVADGKLQYLTEPIPTEPGTGARNAAARATYEEFIREAGAIKNVLIFAMQPNLQRRFITQSAHKIYATLSNEFSKAPRMLQYDVVDHFFKAKLQKGQPVSPDVLSIIENVEVLERNGVKLPNRIIVD